MTRAKKKSTKKPSKKPTKKVARQAKTQSLPDETKGSETLTVFWTITVLMVLVTNLMSVAVHYYLLAHPEAEKLALLKGLLLFSGALVGGVSLIVLPILYRVRKVPPPPGLGGFWSLRGGGTDFGGVGAGVFVGIDSEYLGVISRCVNDTMRDAILLKRRDRRGAKERRAIHFLCEPLRLCDLCVEFRRVLEMLFRVRLHQNSAFPGVRGNGITSRMLAMPVTNWTMRSRPRPKPAWGTVP